MEPHTPRSPGCMPPTSPSTTLVQRSSHDQHGELPSPTSPMSLSSSSSTSRDNATSATIATTSQHSPLNTLQRVQGNETTLFTTNNIPSSHRENFYLRNSIQFPTTSIETSTTSTRNIGTPTRNERVTRPRNINQSHNNLEDNDDDDEEDDDINDRSRRLRTARTAAAMAFTTAAVPSPRIIPVGDLVPRGVRDNRMLLRHTGTNSLSSTQQMLLALGAARHAYDALGARAAQHAQQQQQQQQRREVPRTPRGVVLVRNPSIRPQFRSKTVCELQCTSCGSELCNRGMRATLLGNAKLELFSTDCKPHGVALVFDEYVTHNCACRIRDAACHGCGNIVGYHVTTPCASCLQSCNNGHFWMFLSDSVVSSTRSIRGEPLMWEFIPTSEQDSTARSMPDHSIYGLTPSPDGVVSR